VCFANESAPGGEFAGALIEFPLVVVDAVAISDEYVVFAHEKGLILWNKLMSAECDAYEERLRIAHCAVSPDGQWLAVFQGEHSRFGRNEHEKIASWRIGNDQLVRTGRTRQYNGGVARSPDGRFHAVYERRSDHRWGTRLVILPGVRNRIGRSALVRCAGTLWLTADDRRYLRLCDGKTGKLACAIQLPLPVIAIAASNGAEGYCIAATMNSGDVVAFRVEGIPGAGGFS
jgi:hypothetical protein